MKKKDFLLSDMDIESIIFDMDGVLINSEKYWMESEKRFLSSCVPNIFEFEQQEISGMSIFGIFDYFCHNFPEEMRDVERDIFLQTYTEFGMNEVYSKCDLIPGVQECLECFSQKYPLVLASSALRVWVDEATQKHNIAQYFDHIVTGNDVENAKPNPEIYLLAAEKVGKDPARCLVFEDSHNGLVAAKDAGMKVYGFRNGVNERQDLSRSDEIFDDFQKLAQDFSN